MMAAKQNLLSGSPEVPVIKKEILSVQVYRILKDMIANHRFSPGSRLNVENLTKELGVSRTPIWEAMRRLEQEGLLETIPNRGVFMKEMTLPMALKLYQVREVLEGLAGRLAAAQTDENKLRRMEECLEELGQAVDNLDSVAYSILDFNFHALIYEACGNPFLQEILESIKNKMRPLVPMNRAIFSRGYEEHKKILAALRTRDPEMAEKVMKEHNQGMQERILEVMQEKAGETRAEAAEGAGPVVGGE